MKLYEISSTYRDIIQQIESGEIPDDQAVDLIDQMEGEWQTKAESVGGYILNLRAEVYAIEAAIKRMRERVERTEKRADRLAEYLQWQMQVVGKMELKTPEWRFKRVLNPPRVIVPDESKVPHNYWNERSIKTLDKRLIKQVLDDGFELDWAHLEQSEKLRIG